MVPGGGIRNRDFFGPHVRISEEVSQDMVTLVFDPQTSGGLLIAVPESESLALLAELHRAGDADSAIVGRVVKAADCPIELV